MNLIAAVSPDWAIGFQNELLFKIPADLRHFKNLTMGNIVVMGHNTFRSLPNQKPLPGRTNIVLSRDASLVIPDAIVKHSKEDVISMQLGADVFIIGGGQMYELFLDMCSTAYVTKVMQSTEADCFLANLDMNLDWELAAVSEMHFFQEYSYTFCVYKNEISGGRYET